MNLLSRYEQSIARIDRNYALVIAISSTIAALWMVFRLFMLGFAAITFSSYGVSAFSLVLSFVWTIVLGALATVSAYVFFRRYRQP